MENINILVFLILGIASFVLFLKNKESLNDFVLYLLTITSVYLISENLTSTESGYLETIIVSFVSMSFIASRFSAIKNLKWNWLIPLFLSIQFYIISKSEYSYNLYEFSFKSLSILLLPAIGILIFPVANFVSHYLSVFLKIEDKESLVNVILLFFIGIFAFIGSFFASNFGIFLISIGFISQSFFRNNSRNGGIALLLLSMTSYFTQMVNLDIVDLTLGKTIEGLFIGVFAVALLNLTYKTKLRRGLTVFIGLAFSLFFIFGILLLITQKSDFGGMDAFIGALMGVALGIALIPEFRFSEMLVGFLVSGALFFGPLIINKEEQNNTQITLKNNSSNSGEIKETDPFELPGIPLDSLVGSYIVNEKTVQLTFQLGPKGGVTKGTIKSFSGTIEIQQRIEKSKFEIDLPVAKLTTFNSGRDESIFEKEYFNLEEYPEMHFISKKLVKKDDFYELQGNFEMIGVKKPLTIMLKYIGEFDSNGSKVPVLIGKSSIDRTQFGMEPDSKEGNIVDFTFKVELIKK